MATAHHDFSKIDLETIPSGFNKRIGLVVSSWNASITENLFQGAYQLLLQKGVQEKDLVRLDVPGSFELIYGARMLQNRGFDALIVIGSVVRGETSHFDYVCSAVAQGVKDLNLTGLCPVIFCVLTDDNIQQAEDRSGGKYGNKGTEAAAAALKMAIVS